MIPTLYLGTHEPAWLPRTTVPLFISRRRLERRKSMPRSVGTWALDSGGFTELSLHGRWELPPPEYIQKVRRYRDEIGGMQWAAIQDWMCDHPVHGAARGVLAGGDPGGYHRANASS